MKKILLLNLYLVPLWVVTFILTRFAVSPWLLVPGVLFAVYLGWRIGGVMGVT